MNEITHWRRSDRVSKPKKHTSGHDAGNLRIWPPQSTPTEERHRGRRSGPTMASCRHPRCPTVWAGSTCKRRGRRRGRTRRRDRERGMTTQSVQEQTKEEATDRKSRNEEGKRTRRRRERLKRACEQRTNVIRLFVCFFARPSQHSRYVVFSRAVASPALVVSKVT